MEEDLERQEVELEAIEAIFGDDCCIDRQSRVCEVYVPCRTHQPHLKLAIHLPPTYPSSSAPVAEILAQHLSDDMIHILVNELQERFQPGMETLFDWVEYVREHFTGWKAEEEDGAAPPQSTAELETELPATVTEEEEDVAAEFESHYWEVPASQHFSSVEIISGPPTTEKKSTFQAHVAAITRVDEVAEVMAQLLENNKIRNATHNIMAYRIHVPDKNTFLQDYDDDGETAAGGRLLHLLQVADARNVVVVVSRWFGGILLGPSRFTFINNTARALLEHTGYIHGGGSSSSSSAKPKKKR